MNNYVLSHNSKKVSSSGTISYNSAYRLVCESEIKYQNSWFEFGRSLFLLETGNYEEYISLRDFFK